MYTIFSNNQNNEGLSIYWDDEKLNIEPYYSNKKIYVCGKELLKFHATKSIVYRILSIDLEDACLAEIYSDGEIKVLFSAHSEVPKKHRCGGQSAGRFERIRRNEIVNWYKRINEYLKNSKGDIILSTHAQLDKQLVKYLSTYNKEKISKVVSCEYAGINGIYQTVNKLNSPIA